MFDKMNITVGDWTDKSFYDIILPQVPENTPVIKRKILPVTSSDDRLFWESLRAISDFDLPVIDPTSWYLDDTAFSSYIQKISTVPFKQLCVFDSPFAHEKPAQVNWSDFTRKLIERCKIVKNIIKKQQNTLLVAPPILPLDGEIRDLCMEFLTTGRNLFDVWSMHCITEITEQKIGNITSMLNECLSVLRKPVWVTKFSIPSCEYPIKNPQPGWGPNTYFQAANQTRNIFRIVEGVTKGESKWFHVGTGLDAYHPDKDIPDNLWKPYKLCPAGSVNWTSFHFLGLLDYQKKIKKPVFDTLREMCLNNNV